jgi:hypothetical protein
LESTHLVLFEKLAEYARREAYSAEERAWCQRILCNRVNAYFFNLLRTGNKQDAKRLMRQLKAKGLPTPGLRFRYPAYLPNSVLAALRGAVRQWRFKRRST